MPCTLLQLRDAFLQRPVLCLQLTILFVKPDEMQRQLLDLGEQLRLHVADAHSIDGDFLTRGDAGQVMILFDEGRKAGERKEPVAGFEDGVRPAGIANDDLARADGTVDRQRVLRRRGSNAEVAGAGQAHRFASHGGPVLGHEEGRVSTLGCIGPVLAGQKRHGRARRGGIAGSTEAVAAKAADGIAEAQRGGECGGIIGAPESKIRGRREGVKQPTRGNAVGADGMENGAGNLSRDVRGVQADGQGRVGSHRADAGSGAGRHNADSRAAGEPAGGLCSRGAHVYCKNHHRASYDARAFHHWPHLNTRNSACRCLRANCTSRYAPWVTVARPWYAATTSLALPSITNSPWSSQRARSQNSATV